MSTYTNVSVALLTTPAKFFRDGQFRQEKCQKPSGMIIRDGCRQG